MPESSSREFRPDLAREFQYLLGQMPRVDRETFQGLLIENEEVSERVLEAENELFDAWVHGDLPRDWHPLFEERLLSTAEGRRKAAVARSLAKTAMVQLSERRANPVTNWLRRIAAVFCIAAAVGIWMWWQDREPADDPQPQQVAASVETLRLQTVTRGDANRPKFRIGASTVKVRFTIPESANVAAELATLQGKTIWKGAASESVPASLLPPGMYLLTTFERDGKASNYYEFEISGQ